MICRVRKKPVRVEVRPLLFAALFGQVLVTCLVGRVVPLGSVQCQLLAARFFRPAS